MTSSQIFKLAWPYNGRIAGRDWYETVYFIRMPDDVFSPFDASSGQGGDDCNYRQWFVTGNQLSVSG